MTLEDWKAEQLAVCTQYGAAPVSVSDGDKLGIALDVRTGALPINGVRCRPEHGTCGWYIWAGESMSQDADYFKPLHVRHLEEWCEPAIRFLLLPPGWRFLVAGEYVDVWFDPDVDLRMSLVLASRPRRTGRDREPTCPVMAALRRRHCGTALRPTTSRGASLRP